MLFPQISREESMITQKKVVNFRGIRYKWEEKVGSNVIVRTNFGLDPKHDWILAQQAQIINL